MIRAQISEGHVRVALDRVKTMLLRRLEQKGRGIFVSSHEMLGVVSEEFYELKGSVRACKEHGLHAGQGACVQDELVDIAVGCLLGLASYETGEVEW